MTPQAGDPSSASEELALALCRAVHERSGDQQPPYWVDVAELLRELGHDHRAEVDRAMLFACLRGWLQSEGEPAQRIAVTEAGRRLHEPE